MQALVLCDLDKTLIGVDQRPTVGDLGTLAKTLGKEGVVLGLASDSSHAKLLRWQAAFEFHGPIISERGAILQRTWLSPLEILGPWEPYFAAFHEDVITRIREDYPAIRIIGQIAGGATALQEQMAADEDADVLFFNIGRRCSFAVTAAVVQHGAVYRSSALLETLVRAAKTVHGDRPLPEFPMYWDINPEYGSLIVGPEEAVKALAVRQLLGSVPFRRVIMVGDSMNDFLGIDGIEQWAVANASDEYKRRCKYVARAPLTAGVIELFQQLLP